MPLATNPGAAGGSSGQPLVSGAGQAEAKDYFRRLDVRGAAVLTRSDGLRGGSAGREAAVVAYLLPAGRSPQGEALVGGGRSHRREDAQAERRRLESDERRRELRG
ncbi:MAG: hypothetical protein HY719_07740, partial [Planctomycetes bacterium]|nr:hypothetical protein [Planctomycetota bacterium]